MPNEKMTSTEKKTNEKTISLHPLKFREALAALLATKPLLKKRDSNDEGKSKEKAP